MDERCRVRAEWAVETPEAAWRLAEDLMNQHGAKTAAWTLPGDLFADETDGKAEATIERVREHVERHAHHRYSRITTAGLLAILNAKEA